MPGLHPYQFDNHAFQARSRHRPAAAAAHPQLQLHILLGYMLLVIATLLISLSSVLAASNGEGQTGQVEFVRFVQPSDMTSGALLLQAQEEGRFVEAPMLATDVDITVTGPIIRSTVTQRFENPADGWVEGVYVFPLPDGAAVDTLRIRIGDRIIEGQIKEREEARQMYEEARDEGRKASLVEQERPNMFTNSVANIGPGETVIIQIEYQETVQQSNGVFSLRFPMVVAPRFNPDANVHTVQFDNGSDWGQVNDPVPDRDRISPPVLDPDLGSINPVTMTVTLKPGFDLGDVKSAYHEIVLRRTGDDTAILTFKEGEIPADRDFELTWAAKDGNAPTAALFRENVDGNEYALLFLTPPVTVPDTDRQPLPREVILVIDNSGSMGGPSIVQARESLLYALSRLRPNDRFNVIRFDNTMEMLFPSPVLATERNTAFASGFVSQLEADGGTVMLPALKAALVDRDSGNEDVLRQVIFLTDGAIGNEDQMFREIARNRGRSRIFTVGIGSAPNSFFMTRAAEIGRGTFTHIGDVNQVRERMTELFAKLENPVLTDLEVAWSGGDMRDISPSPLPDLYRGEPIVLTARAGTLPDSMRITGKLDGKPWSAVIKFDNAREGSGLGKLWARRRIASLESDRSRGNGSDAIDKTITEIALEHHIVSRLTSLVAIDVTPSRPGDETVERRDIPLNLPSGWDFDKVFGEQDDQARLRRANALSPIAPAPAAEQMAFLSSAVATSATRSESEARGATRGLILPQTATLSERQILIGILLLLFAFTCLVMRAMWSRAMRSYSLPRHDNRVG
jgi:Ca-activated chloride channel homolog